MFALLLLFLMQQSLHRAFQERTVAVQFYTPLFDKKELLFTNWMFVCEPVLLSVFLSVHECASVCAHLYYKWLQAANWAKFPFIKHTQMLCKRSIFTHVAVFPRWLFFLFFLQNIAASSRDWISLNQLNSSSINLRMFSVTLFQFSGRYFLQISTTGKNIIFWVLFSNKQNRSSVKARHTTMTFLMKPAYLCDLE